MEQNVIDNPIELLVYVLIVLAFLMILFKFNNWLDARPIKEKPVKEKKVKSKKEKKTEVVKETIKEVVKDNNNDIKVTIDKDAIVKEVKEQVYNDMAFGIRGESIVDNSNNANRKNGYSNYLYDRFVDTPTIDDNIEQKKAFEGFLSDDEVKDIKDRNIKINVKDTEEIYSEDIKKNNLYKRIEQLASENLEAKEQMLKDFEKLPKSMKLLLIENIMEKM